MIKCNCGFKIGHPSFAKCVCDIPKPLSDEEIDKLADEYLSDYFNMQETINFAKAIEERHGIK